LRWPPIKKSAVAAAADAKSRGSAHRASERGLESVYAKSIIRYKCFAYVAMTTEQTRVISRCEGVCERRARDWRGGVWGRKK
jgi:hypothetical protein